MAADDSSSLAAAENRVRNRRAEAMRYSAMGNGFYSSPEENLSPTSRPDAPPVQSAAANPIRSLLGNLGINSFLSGVDPEQLLLMILIVLLVSEGKNFILAAALIYVLM